MAELITETAVVSGPDGDADAITGYGVTLVETALVHMNTSDVVLALLLAESSSENRMLSD